MFYNHVVLNFGTNMMKGATDLGTKLCVFSCLAIIVTVLSSSVGGVGVGIAQSQNNVASLTPAQLPQVKGRPDGERRNKTQNDLVINNKGKYNGGGGGGGGGGGFGWGWGWGWGWGGGGGGGRGRGGGGGGGGGGSWGWGCRKQAKHRRNHLQHVHKKRGGAAGDDHEYYKVGEFAQCVVQGRCRGMRLDCPLHCGGPCFYDCIHMCKAHCLR